MLPAVPDRWDLRSLVLCDNFIGDRGLLPVLEVCRANPLLRDLGLPGNGICNAGVQCLVDMCLAHPSLRALDLRKNRRITLPSAALLQRLVQQNRNICAVHLADTRISHGYQQRILRIAGGNAMADPLSA